MEDHNIILLTDSYKISHWPQYPKGTTSVFSYLESRGGKFDQTLFFGLQYIIKKYLLGVQVTTEKIAEAKEISRLHLGNDKLFNEEGWLHILNNHGGKLPVVIRAVPEGLIIPTSNVLLTIENTDPKCFWLTNYLESLLVQTWYPITIATYSRECKKIIKAYLEETGDVLGLDFKLHDFGYRGSTSTESAGIGGLSHLVNFQGTDTLEAIIYAKKYYGETMAGFSIPASEHSTITSWGRMNEIKAMENMLDQYGHLPFVACVSDSYDIFNACEKIWGETLKNKVQNMNATLIIRPDSGHPPEIIGKVLNILGEKFGYITNDKGYKVLNKVRVIQGDGIDLEMIKIILASMYKDKWSADNIAFGSGGGLLQKHDRDEQKFAFKCSSITIDGEDRDVYKEPVTDTGKVSKKGRLKLVLIDGAHGKSYHTMATGISQEPDILEEVFRDGELKKEYTFSEIRERATTSDIKYWETTQVGG